MDEIRRTEGNDALANLRMDASSRLVDSSKPGSSSFASEMGNALNSLSGLDNSDKLREDAIQNAKAIIKNWTPPTDSQITTIIQKMRDELLA